MRISGPATLRPTSAKAPRAMSNTIDTKRPRDLPTVRLMSRQSMRLPRGAFPFFLFIRPTYHSISAMACGRSLSSTAVTRPSCIWITRSAMGAIAELCVTITVVAPRTLLIS